MSLEMWIAFVIAAMIVLVIPGPTILLVISQSISHGRRAVVPLVTGVTLGDFTAMTLSLLGLGAILAASATLFSVLKFIGAVYLICLGIKLWRSNPGKHEISLADTHDALKACLKLRSSNRTKRVFLVEKGTYKGQAISVRGIQKRLEYYAKKTRINVSCHRLRHTMATQLLKQRPRWRLSRIFWVTTGSRPPSDIARYRI